MKNVKFYNWLKTTESDKKVTNIIKCNFLTSKKYYINFALINIVNPIKIRTVMTRVINSAVKHTAQAYLCAEAENGTPSGACGSACGAGEEKPEPKPAACGSACGAGEK